MKHDVKMKLNTLGFMFQSSCYKTLNCFGFLPFSKKNKVTLFTLDSLREWYKDQNNCQSFVLLCVFLRVVCNKYCET